MSNLIQFTDHIILWADYVDPKPHCHLASHLIIAIDGEAEWTIDGEYVKCRSLYVKSNVLHVGKMPTGGCLVLLFPQYGMYTSSINDKFTTGKSYEIVEDSISYEVIRAYNEYRNDIQALDKEILHICGIKSEHKINYDDRIQEAFVHIRNSETISAEMLDVLSKKACLSKSRFSHLFRKETGMTLHSYLALEKLRKTYQYMQEGKSITESCIMAGFNSSSHCSATCKRMFGISLSEFHKSLATR